MNMPLLKIKDCQYVGVNPTACGCTALHNNSSYCEEHYGLVYRVGSGRAVRHKDIRTANRIWDLQNELNMAIAELEAEGFL